MVRDNQAQIGRFASITGGQGWHTGWHLFSNYRSIRGTSGPFTPCILPPIEYRHSVKRPAVLRFGRTIVRECLTTVEIRWFHSCNQISRLWNSVSVSPRGVAKAVSRVHLQPRDRVRLSTTSQSFPAKRVGLKGVLRTARERPKDTLDRWPINSDACFTCRFRCYGSSIDVD